MGFENSQNVEIENFTTKELANLFKVRPGTVRRGFCVKGHYLGLRPCKLPNGRLMWPSEQALSILNR